MPEGTTGKVNPDIEIAVENVEVGSTVADEPFEQHHTDNARVERLTGARVGRLQEKLSCLKENLATSETKTASTEKTCQKVKAELQYAKKAAVEHQTMGTRKRAVIMDELVLVVNAEAEGTRASMTVEFASLRFLLDQEYRAQLTVVR